MLLCGVWPGSTGRFKALSKGNPLTVAHTAALESAYSLSVTRRAVRVSDTEIRTYLAVRKPFQQVCADIVGDRLQVQCRSGWVVNKVKVSKRYGGHRLIGKHSVESSCSQVR
jgi:hypothetical protein